LRQPTFGLRLDPRVFRIRTGNTIPLNRDLYKEGKYTMCHINYVLAIE